MASLDVKAISLLVQHASGKAYNSLYIVPVPPLESAAGSSEDNSNGNIIFELNAIKPVCHFPPESSPLLEGAEIAAVGTQIYFLGGVFHPRAKPDAAARAVYALDTDKPEEGLRPVAPLNYPKERPCVFVSDGMVYALGFPAGRGWGPEPVPGWTGLFERYDPKLDKWEVLPDPPLSLKTLAILPWSQLGTVVGRDVYFGNRSRRVCVFYNLDSKQWRSMSSSLANPLTRRFPFPCGSVYVDGYLYYLRGGACPNLLPVSYHEAYSDDEPLQLVAKRFPVGPAHSAPGRARVIAKAHELDGGFFFTDADFFPWRDLFHLGGRFFCYVVSSELDSDEPTLDNMTRGIGINVFEVVQTQLKLKFRPVASVCYTAPTHHPDLGVHVRFSALTTLPNCLTKIISKGEQCEAAAKAKMYSETKSVDNHEDLAHREVIPDMSVRKGDNQDMDLKDMILKTQQVQISRLMAKLAAKEELLKARVTRK